MLIYKSGRGVAREDLQNLSCWRRCRCTRYVFGRPTADHVKRSLSPLCRAWSRRLRAPLPSVEGRSVFGARASPGLREGCPGDERSRRSPSRLLPSTPTKLCPAVSNPGGGCKIGGAPSARNPVQCCQYAPWLDLATCQAGTAPLADSQSIDRRTPNHVHGAGWRLKGCRGGRRSGPTHRSGSERYFPCSPGPYQAPRSPRVVQGQRKARRITGQTTYLHGGAFL
jgi:hypothetical protein